MTDAAKSVAVLGAGVSGLAAAKTLKQYGFEVTIFEARSRLGGVWANNYRSLHVLEPACVYGFPDFPWPKGTSLFPSAQEVRAYLTAYARNFDIFDRIKFDFPVIQASPIKNGRWLIVAGPESSRHPQEFDFFIMAPGMFNHPKIPQWPGIDNFEGELIHSSGFHDVSQVENKNVAIVGFSRSAMDIAVDITDYADSVTILHRSVRWPVPEKILGLIRNHVLLFARWPTLFAQPWIRPGRATAFLHGKLMPVVNFFWKFFEVLLSSQFRLRSLGMLPDRSIKQDLFTNLYVAPRRFFSLVGAGVIRSERSDIESIEQQRVRLDNGKLVAADVVICATGWRHEYSFLPADLLDRIYDGDGMHLYRHMVHPDLPGMAFIGGVQGLNSATLFAIQATWVARYLSGALILPADEEQLEEIESLRLWNLGFVTKRPNRSQILNLHQLPYIDELMTDMEIKKRRKIFLLDQLVPYRSVDYETVTSSVYPQ